MSFFVVKSCALKACLNWREGNTCVKNNMHIASQLKYIANMHHSSVCEVRRQIDIYRLENILEK